MYMVHTYTYFNFCQSKYGGSIKVCYYILTKISEDGTIGPSFFFKSGAVACCKNINFTNIKEIEIDIYHLQYWNGYKSYFMHYSVNH